jgi:hypothetical protein
MQRELAMKIKHHFFADYFGKHFPRSLAKADEYAVT